MALESVRSIGCAKAVCVIEMSRIRVRKRERTIIPDINAFLFDIWTSCMNDPTKDPEKPRLRLPMCGNSQENGRCFGGFVVKTNIRSTPPRSDMTIYRIFEKIG
jgi:hypothetical protein